jgi:carbamoyltransferase
MNKKLLSFSFGHDGAISYFDGTNLHYVKLERLSKIKHDAFTYENQVKNALKEIFKITLDEIDEICLISGIPENVDDFCKNYKHKKISVIEHHYAHCLSVEFLHGEGDVSIAIDGEGNDNIVWAVYKKNQLVERCLWSEKTQNKNFGGLGLFVECFLGFYCGVSETTKLTDVSGKFMSLQNYGNINDVFLKFLLEENLNMENFHLIEDIFKKFDEKIPKLDIGRTFHYYVEKYLLPNFFKKYCKPSDKILYSGGVAQNIVWNTELKKIFPNLMIAPHSYDGGLSLGGIEYLRRKSNLPKFDTTNFPYISISEVPEEEVTVETIKKAAKLLSENKIIAWYQGHSEVGPRALGNRSILMNPMIKNGKELINQIKKRENYRPFGASVLKEHTQKYFDIPYNSPYMLYTAKVKDPLLESITHIDGTCRIQTVEENPKHFRMLLEEFYKLTGCPILLNTSLNVAGEPIAAYKEQALRLLNETNLDYVFIGNKVHEKMLKIYYG